MLEICKKSEVTFIDEPLYYYRIHPNNDHNINSGLQKQVELEIRKKKSFK